MNEKDIISKYLEAFQAKPELNTPYKPDYNPELEQEQAMAEQALAQEQAMAEQALAQESAVQEAPEEAPEEAPIEEAPEEVPEEVPRRESLLDKANLLYNKRADDFLSGKKTPKQQASEEIGRRFTSQTLSKGETPDQEKATQFVREGVYNKKAPDTQYLKDMMEKYNKLTAKEKEDLSAAQEKDRQQELQNSLMASAQRLNKALSGSNIGEYKGLSAKEVKNLKERQKIDREGLDRQLKFSEKIKELERKGEVTIAERQILKSMEDKIAKGQEISPTELQAVEKMAEASNSEVKDLINMGTGLANAEGKNKEKELTAMDKKRMDNYDKLDENRNRNFDLKKSSKISDRFFQLADKMKTKDFRYKDAYKESLAFEQVEKLMNLAEKGNATVFGSVGTKMARAMGEVGVLTESDVTRYVNSQKLTQKGADILNKWRTGKPSKATIKELKEIAAILQETHSIKLKPVFDEYANMAYKNLQDFGDVSRFESYDRLAIPIPSKYRKAKMFFESDKNQKFLKEKGIKNLKQAEDYLTEIGKL